MHKKIEKIIIKFITNSINEDELNLLSKWLEDNKNEKLFLEFVKINYAIDYNISSFNKQKSKLLFLSHIEDDMPTTANNKKRFKYSKFWKYAAAAVIIMMVSLPFILRNSNIRTNEVPSIVSQEPILPGSDKAILTLEDGNQVSLEKGKKYSKKNIQSDGENLFYKDNTIKQSKEIAYNYLTIPRGGQFFVKLSDGTKVWLNSDSKLKYPVSFIKGETRQVELVYGEAYFDVSPSTKHEGSKFKVNTETQDIVVLGTEFNINSYKNNDVVYTTLVEGSVVIKNGVSSKVLSPGQQSINNIKNDQLEVMDVDVSYYTAWKNGFFMFDKESLHEMMNILSRWYDINVVFESDDKRDIIFSGLLNRDDSINELLKYLEKTNEVEFEITNNTIIVK